MKAWTIDRSEVRPFADEIAGMYGFKMWFKHLGENLAKGIAWLRSLEQKAHDFSRGSMSV